MLDWPRVIVGLFDQAADAVMAEAAHRVAAKTDLADQREPSIRKIITAYAPPNLSQSILYLVLQVKG